MAQQTSSADDFSVLPISMPKLPSYPVQTTHYVYLRRNAKVLTDEDARSLYLVNVPADSTETHFRAVFASLVGAGRFEAMTFEQDLKARKTSFEPAQAIRLAGHHKKRKREEEEAQHAKEEEISQLPSIWTRQLRRSGSSALVLLADEKSVDLVLKAVKKLHKSKKYPVWGEGIGDKVPPLGSPWLSTHKRLVYPGNDAMQVSVDAFFTVYNRKEAEAEQLAREMRNEPDEDGFITVTRGGRAAPARKEEAEVAKRKMVEKQKKRMDETQNFYRWQMREKRKAEQAAFLKKFEEDKYKLRTMREKRRKIQPEE